MKFSSSHGGEYDVQTCLLGYIIPDDGGSTHLWNVGRQSFYTAVYPRTQLWTEKNEDCPQMLKHAVRNIVIKQEM
jgi:hypothetical protein